MKEFVYVVFRISSGNDLKDSREQLTALCKTEELAKDYIYKRSEIEKDRPVVGYYRIQPLEVLHEYPSPKN